MAASAKITWKMHDGYNDIFFWNCVLQRHIFVAGLRRYEIIPGLIPMFGIHITRAIQERMRVPTTAANNCTTGSG